MGRFRGKKLAPVLAAAGVACWGLAAEVRPTPAPSVFQQDVAWSPDGRWLAFSELADSGNYRPENWGIHRVEVATGERRPVIDNALWVDWSPDGARLVFGSARDGDWEIYTIAVDGTDLRRVTRHPADDRSPAWSPAGDRIAFCSDRDGDEDIYVMDVDGSRPRRITDDPAKDYNPAWSPDGSSLVFYRERGDGMDQIWVVAADGTGERAITADTANNVFPGFTPEGDIVFHSSRDGEAILVRVAADGSERQTLADVPGFYARVSPDGERLAFVAGRWPASAIWVAARDGSGARRLAGAADLD